MLTLLTRPSSKRSALHRKTIGGHYAVTRSLLAGLDALRVPYRYDPAFQCRITSDVWVLAGVDTLQYAIALKRAGRIGFLGAGPNISVLPSWDRHVLAAPEVDVCVVPSQWVSDAYLEDSPNLVGRICTWYAGVDPVSWAPSERGQGGYCLVYSKTENTPLAQVLRLLKQLSVPVRVIEYGTYCSAKYKHLLENALCMVVLSHSESQGIALAEAWAMNVPTFCWNPGFSFCGVHRFDRVHAAPYITEMTGAVWNATSELERILTSFLSAPNSYKPRYWLSCYMTDTRSARLFLNIYSAFTP